MTKNDVRMVVNTTNLSQHLKNLPTKVTKPQEIYSALSRWKYIVKTDLHQGFFQNHLHPSAYQWCAIQTPFGGMRHFKRSIQGLIGQTEEQDEMLAKVLHKHLQAGICIKIADDIFCGGTTVEEAIDNWETLMETLSRNNLKLSPTKTVIFPKSVDILSWVWKTGGYLSPSPHRKQALQKVKHEDILKIKDVRSWVGLFKTFMDCTPNLTKFMDPFDQLTGGKQSNDIVTWTPELIQHFNKAKEQIDHMEDLYLPTPEDQLIITCDGARTPPAVGMLLQAKNSKGETKVVKFYSVKLKPHILKWFPCEIEAAALGTAIEAFYEYIKQAKKPVIICPDSKAVVDAAAKIKKGHFSLSPKIQTFLNNLSRIKYDIQHISGKSGHNAAGDYLSRTAEECKSELCQICNFVETFTDTVIDVKLNTIKEAENDRTAMPFLNRKTWIELQSKDKACNIAKTSLTTGQQPSKKQGKTLTDARKYVAKGTIAKDGLLIVEGVIPMTTTKMERIIIPTPYVDAILTQLHNKFNHPAKTQLTSLFNRYFFASGSSQTIEQIYTSCHTCQSMIKLPQNMQQYKTTTTALHPGTHYGIDVVKRAKQKILVARDQFSSHTTAQFIPDETYNTLRDGVINLISTTRSQGKVIVRVDNAPAFKSIKLKKDQALTDLNITIELSDPLNKNGNACVDRAISELIDNIKKIIPEEVPITQATLAKAVSKVNTKIRRGGNLSANEILFARDSMSNVNLQIQDDVIADHQADTRQQNNERHNIKISKHQEKLQRGDLVQLKNKPSKHTARDTYIVTNSSAQNVTINKMTNILNDKKPQISITGTILMI